MKKEKKVSASREGWKTSAKERMFYAIGYNASTGQSLLLQAYLSTYLLMSGIPLSVSAAVLLVIKVIDAIDDMLFGWIIDRFHPEQNPKLRKLVGDGRFMPWLKLFFYVMPVAVILLYQIPGSFSVTAKCVWFCVFYLLADLGYTIMDVPMQSLLTTMTENNAERDRIIMIRNLLQSAVMGVVYLGTSILISRYVGVSISNTILIFSVMMVLLMLPMMLTVKEHAILNRARAEMSSNNPAADAQSLQNTTSFMDSLKALFANRNLLAHYGGYILSACLATGSAAGMFGSYYLFGNEMLTTLLGMPTGIVSLVLLIWVPKLAQKYDKNRLRMVTMPIGIILSAMIYFSGYKNLVMYAVLTCLSAIPAGIASTAGTYLVPECIEYGKYVTQKDCTGIQFAFSTFAYKIPSAVAGSLGLWILDLYGWIPIEAESFAEIAALNIQQSATAIQGLWNISAGIPVLGSILAYICYMFYNLKSKDAQIMARCNCGEITREEAEAMLSKKY